MLRVRVSMKLFLYKADSLAFPDTFDSPVVKDKSPPFNLLPYESGDI